MNTTTNTTPSTELTKGQIKEQFRDHGFAMIDGLETAGLAFVKEQSSKNGVHTKRAYVRISDCAAIIKDIKVPAKKKIAKALLELMHEFRNATESQASNYMTLVATGNSRTFGFSVPCPQALKAYYKELTEFTESFEKLPENEQKALAKEIKEEVKKVA
tara:strand:- start:102 stop:578 length:477 start_codon:yes stop_codon:yes gene_type:complete